MPHTYAGFGTMFCGEADLRPDGSYVTTEWIAALSIPLLPLGSFRLVRIKECGPNVGAWRYESFAVLERLSICWPQVGRVYALLVGTAGWWAATGWLVFVKLAILDWPSARVFGFLFAFPLAAPLALVWWLRRRAFRNRYGVEPPPPNEKDPSEVPAAELTHQGELDNT